MKSEITQQSDVDATVKVSLNQSALDPMVKRTFDRLRTRVKAAGFRPGKAPNHIVERELGSSLVHDEVMEDAVKDSYARAVTSHQLAVVSSPKVSVTKFVPYSELEYTAKMSLMPTVSLPDYSKVKAKLQTTHVDESEIDRVVEDLRRRLAERNPANRPAEIGDEVRVDFDGTIEGKPSPGTSSKNYLLLLGSDVMIPGFEDQLVGVKAGENKQFEIKFPDDYRAQEIRGKKVQFNVLVSEVTALTLPPADDKFAEAVSPHKTLSDLRTDIKDRISAEKTDNARQQFENAVVDEIVAAAKFNLPESMLHDQLHRLRGEMSERLTAEGLDIDKYLQINQLSPDELEAQLRPEAERRVKLAIILTEVAKTEKLSVSKSEVESEHQRLKQAYQDPEVQKELSGPHIQEEIYNHLLATRTIRRILEKVEATH